MSLTIQALQAVGATPARAAEVLEPLSAACAFYGIDTPERLALFLAQVGHESGGFRYAAELWGPTPAQQRYEGRADLGNTQPGDGSRFRGHGFIQTTGRFNHAKVRDRLRERFPDVPDFEQEPQRLAEMQWACLSAADYWDMKAINPLADAGDFEAVTRRINGGLNGLADRKARWERVKQALGAAPAPIVHLGPEPRALHQVVPISAPVQQEPQMFPFLAAALPSLISAVPELIKMFGSGSEISERNAKAAEIAVTVAKEALGARNEQEMVETLQNDPEAAATVRKAVQDNWWKLEEVGGGIQAARVANVEVTKAGDLAKNPAFILTLLLLPLVYFVVAHVMYGDLPNEIKSMVIAAVISGVLGAMTGFWLGTSFSSSKKTDLLAGK